MIAKTKLELELKVLDIDPMKVEERLADIGAIWQFTSILREVAFDHPKFKLRKKGLLFRLRTDGRRNNQSILTIKNKPVRGNILMREEMEITLYNNCDEGIKFFKKLGFRVYRDRQKLRTEYSYGATTIEIDAYPAVNDKVKPYVEIEGENDEAITAMIKKLKFTNHRATNATASELLVSWGVKKPDYIEFSPEELKKLK